MMERQRNYIYPDKDSMVGAFLCEVQRFLEEVAEAGKPVNIAVSGGSTPLALFKMLAEQTRSEDWSRVHIYWVDERCVPPGHPESNYGNASRSLLTPLELHNGQIHRIMGEEDPAREADRYANLLKHRLPGDGGFPVFDWLWLGLGSDGHTASIFPHQIELWNAESNCVIATHPESGQKRISLSGGVINAARRVSFLATGQEKALIIKNILMKEGDYLEYPAFYVNPGSDHLEWYLDQEAANLL
jgi:6-phosphogluconolactonase